MAYREDDGTVRDLELDEALAVLLARQYQLLDSPRIPQELVEEAWGHVRWRARDAVNGYNKWLKGAE